MPFSDEKHNTVHSKSTTQHSTLIAHYIPINTVLAVWLQCCSQWHRKNNFPFRVTDIMLTIKRERYTIKYEYETCIHTHPFYDITKFTRQLNWILTMKIQSNMTQKITFTLKTRWTVGGKLRYITISAYSNSFLGLYLILVKLKVGGG